LRAVGALPSRPHQDPAYPTSFDRIPAELRVRFEALAGRIKARWPSFNTFAMVTKGLNERRWLAAMLAGLDGLARAPTDVDNPAAYYTEIMLSEHQEINFDCHVIEEKQKFGDDLEDEH
jgi:hypothetical protein